MSQTLAEPIARLIEEFGKLPGIGPKTAQRLLTQLSNPVQKPKRRLHLHQAWSTADQCIEYLKAIDDVVDASVAGSLRRWEETIGVIDIVASAKDPATVVEKFQQFPLVLSSQLDGPNACVAHFADGAQVWLTVVSPEEFGITLFVKTGSQSHIEKIKDYAERKKVGFARLPRTEEQLYKRLGMAYIPPELREGTDEIALGRNGALPKLVTMKDLRGVLHVHTDFSDGVNTLVRDPERAAEMGKAGRTRVLEHFAWPAIARQTADLYRSLAAGSAPG